MEVVLTGEFVVGVSGGGAERRIPEPGGSWVVVVLGAEQESGPNLWNYLFSISMRFLTGENSSTKRSIVLRFSIFDAIAR